MSAETWSAVGSVVGGVGGLAGLAALGVQGVQWRSQRRTAHIPPEVRPLLLEMSQVAERVIKRRQPQTWINDHVAPLRERWEPLAHLMVSADKGDHLQVAAISYHLHSLTLLAIPTIESDAIGHYEGNRAQGEHARGLADAVTDMYLRVTGQRPAVRPSDGSDMPPQTAPRWSRPLNLR